MSILCSYTYLLSLTLLTVFSNTSLAEGININENLLRSILQGDEQSKSPPLGIPKLVDQRLSDVIAENVLHFGHTIGLELAAQDPHATKSEIFSPLSLMAALSLLTLGAKGKSYQELKQVLGLDSDSELITNPNKYHEEFGLMLKDLHHKNANSQGISKRPNAHWRVTPHKQPTVFTRYRHNVSSEHFIKIANGLFLQNNYSLNPDYSQVVQSIYGTELIPLDFQSRGSEARAYINDWVNKATFGKIPQIIKDDIEKTTNIILASTLYFKAFWETAFFFEATTEANFYPDGEDNPPIRVQMMPTGGIFPSYDANEYDCRIIGLPYKGNETTMYIIQPNNSSRQKLRNLQRVLDAHKINRMIDKMERKTTVLVFPKMHFSRSLHMKKILQTMNVRDIFVNGFSDLSLIGRMAENAFAGALAAAQVPTLGRSTSLEPITPVAQYSPERTVRDSVPVSFESIYRKKPQEHLLVDRYSEPPLIFSSRLGEIENSTNNPLNFSLNCIKNQTKAFSSDEKPPINIDAKAEKREKRQALNLTPDIASLALSNLESYRQNIVSYKSDLYVSDIIHDVNFSVDEQGTEAAAATLTYLHRSGTDVVFRGDTPFLIIIRHDPTKLPLFYGIINKPEL